MLTVTPGCRGLVIAVEGHCVTKAIAAPPIWMVAWVRGIVRNRSFPFNFPFSFSSICVFSCLFGAGGGGCRGLRAVEHVDLRVGGVFNVSVTVSLCVRRLLCLLVSCLGRHGVVGIFYSIHSMKCGEKQRYGDR